MKKEISLKPITEEINQVRTNTYHTAFHVMTIEMKQKVLRAISMKIGFGLHTGNEGTIEEIRKKLK